MRIQNGFGADNGTTIGPVSGSTITASDIVFYVGGTDAQSSFSYAVNISPKSNVKANILAPNGTLLLNQETVAIGAFLAKDVQIGKLVQLTVASAFGGSVAQPVAGRRAETNELLSLSEAPTVFSLAQNYPNPFNPTTQIRYGLPKQSHVILAIYNMLGQEIARLLDEDQREGYHEVRWDGRSRNGALVSSGVYFYRITAGSFVDIKKMMLLK